MDCICEILLYLCELLDKTIKLCDKEITNIEMDVLQRGIIGVVQSLTESLSTFGLCDGMCEDPYLYQTIFYNNETKTASLEDLCSSHNYITGYLLNNEFLTCTGFDTYYSVFTHSDPISVLPSLTPIVARVLGEKEKEDESHSSATPIMAPSRRGARRSHGRKLLFEPESEEETPSHGSDIDILTDKDSPSLSQSVSPEPPREVHLDEVRLIPSVPEEETAPANVKALTPLKTSTETTITFPSRRMQIRTPSRLRSVSLSLSSSDEGQSLTPTSQKYLTPSATYRVSLFSIDSSSIHENTLKGQFVQTLNNALILLLNKTASYFSVSYQIQCIRAVLHVYEKSEGAKLEFLNYIYTQWIHTFVVENHPDKMEVIQFLLEMVGQSQPWRISVACQLETNLIAILEKCKDQLDEDSETLFMNEWAVLLAIYKQLKDNETFLLLSSLLSHFFSSLTQYCAKLFSAFLILGLSLYQVVTREHAQALFIGKARYILLKLQERISDMDADAVSATSFFLLWLVQNDQFDPQPNISLIILFCIQLGKRGILLLDSLNDLELGSSNDKEIDEEKGEEDRERMNEVLVVLGHVNLTLVKRGSELFQEELSHFSTLDRKLIQFCCQKYARLKS